MDAIQNFLGMLIVFSIPILVIGLPIAWFISELRNFNKKKRMILGILAILMCYGVAYLFGKGTWMRAYSLYGDQTKTLLGVTISQIEAGNTNIVLNELRYIKSEYSKTRSYYYQFYTQLVNNAIARMENEP